jgi:hypothetical protein
LALADQLFQKLLQDNKDIRTGIIATNYTCSDIRFDGMKTLPIVFSQSQTYNGSQAVVTRQRDIQTGIENNRNTSAYRGKKLRAGIHRRHLPTRTIVIQTLNIFS